MKCRPHYHAQAIIAIVALTGSLLAANITSTPPPVDNAASQRVPGDVELGRKNHVMGSNDGGSDGSNTQIPNLFFPVPTVSTLQNPAPSHTQDPAPSHTLNPSTTAQLPSQSNPSTSAVPHPVFPLPVQPPSTQSSSTQSPSTQPPITHHAASIPSANAAHPVASPGSNGGAMPIGSVVPTGGTTVPTKVSENAMIGFWTTAGLIVCTLGSLALWNRRKKKNLAAELLQQTAQFNHNNPYTKIPGPAKVAAKGNMHMASTTPLGTYNVLAVYTPTLADEIEIGLGDSVTILQEYDDGWCLGVNNSRNGVRGVFPRHCLEGCYDDSVYNNSQYNDSQYGNSHYGGGGYYPPNAGFRVEANKRMSSIPAGGWNSVPVGYSGGGDNYRSPTSQYNGNYNYNGGY